jgi:hypothetical protein
MKFLISKWEKRRKKIRRLVSVNKSTECAVFVCVCACFPFSYLGLAERRTKKRRNVKKGNRSSRWLPPDWPFLYNSSSFSLCTVSVACARLSGRRNGECCPANGKPTGGGLGSIFPVIMLSGTVTDHSIQIRKST